MQQLRVDEPTLAVSLRGHCLLAEFPYRIEGLAVETGAHGVGTQEQVGHVGARVLVDPRIQALDRHVARRTRSVEVAVVLVDHDSQWLSGGRGKRGGKQCEREYHDKISHVRHFGIPPLGRRAPGSRYVSSCLARSAGHLFASIQRVA